MVTMNHPIVWIIVVAFAATYVISICALTGIIKVEKKFLAPLFAQSVLPILAAGLFLFYTSVRTPSPPPYLGEWKGTIYWHDDYARVLFNHGDADPVFQPANPRSEGSLYVYVSKSGVYKGFSTWETKNGEHTYSKLAVLLSDFTFDPSGALRAVSMKTAFRTPVRQFSYGPFTRYQIQFNYVSENHMAGKMLVDAQGRAREVGEVVMERE
ncbi:MAG: hypothetical protein M3441_23445 [Chloroflexota bacterium]|nr:hypothetical protein [Chloroflexota bacterium]